MKKLERLRKHRGMFRNNPPFPPLGGGEDLQKQLENLRIAFDTNAAVFRDTLMALDASVQALAAVLDCHVSKLPVRRTEDGVHVDYNYYLTQFYSGMKKPPPTEERSIVSLNDDETHIFGGEG